jgi:hypothetical protein
VFHDIFFCALRQTSGSGAKKGAQKKRGASERRVFL